jgi:predicted ester cyclase
MGIEENKAIVKRYIEEILNSLDYTHAKELMHEDFFGLGGAIKTVEDHEKRFKEQRKQAPDLRNNLKELIAEGNKVVAISSLTVTDISGYAGHPPTNKKLEIKVIAVYTLKDGKIVKGEILTDSLGMFQQLGFYPPLPEGK